MDKIEIIKADREEKHEQRVESIYSKYKEFWYYLFLRNSALNIKDEQNTKEKKVK